MKQLKPCMGLSYSEEYYMPLRKKMVVACIFVGIDTALLRRELNVSYTNVCFGEDRIRVE